jgi:DNA-binding MarR family transcriptional regulator
MTSELETLGRAIKQAQYRQHRRLDAALTRIDTTLVQWDAMRAIAQRPGASAHDLAVATFQTDQSFGRLANRLLAQGMITRGSGFGRRIEHQLTAAGERKLSEATAIAGQVRAELFAPLSSADRSELQRILAVLLADLDGSNGGSL